MCALCENVLEGVTIPVHPQIAAMKEEMIGAGALTAMMSGSGPSVFGIFADQEKAESMCQTLRVKPEKIQAFLTKPYFP